jgi:CRP-like cAMP-binding protein
MATHPNARDLSSIWLFSECTAREQRTIAKALDEVTVPAGRVIVEEGTLGREFYLIVSGTAVVKRNGRKVATLGAGQHFGELALLDRLPRNATVVSETELDVLVLGQREFNGLLETTPSIARKLMAAMAGRLREHDRTAPQ